MIHKGFNNYGKKDKLSLDQLRLIRQDMLLDTPLKNSFTEKTMNTRVVVPGGIAQIPAVAGSFLAKFIGIGFIKWQHGGYPVMIAIRAMMTRRVSRVMWKSLLPEIATCP